MHNSIELRDEDKEFFQRELDSFVPDRVFDAHTHIWNADHSGFSKPGLIPTVGIKEYRDLVEGLHPKRPVSALFIPFPHKDRFAAGNEWVSQQVLSDPSCRGLFFIKPTDDPDWVRQEVKRLGLHGLKCYHLYSSSQPTWESDIPSYLPDNIVAVANQEGWPIMLHIVKSGALSDARNIYWIRYYCERYPNIKLILAHSGRGFQPAHNLDGLPKLVGLNNLYFDTSANCEPTAHQAIIRIMGHRKIMYGSDLPVSHERGRSVAAADSFLWLHEKSLVWGEKHLKIKPVLLGLEHLRSIKWACWSERLSDSAVEDIFWNNAAELLNVSDVRA